MNNPNLVLLVVENNDYQAEETISAKEAAHECEADFQVIRIEHDAVIQSQEVLKLLYRPAGARPDGILFEPVGTPLVQPARIAASSGVGWVVLNREVGYLSTSVRICGDVLLNALCDVILLSLALGEACSDAKKKPFLSDSRRRRTATPGVLGASVYVTLL
jgi:hypothetical protein